MRVNACDFPCSLLLCTDGAPDRVEFAIVGVVICFCLALVKNNPFISRMPFQVVKKSLTN